MEPTAKNLEGGSLLTPANIAWPSSWRNCFTFRRSDDSIPPALVESNFYGTPGLNRFFIKSAPQLQSLCPL
jgi:hypothetical protein